MCARECVSLLVLWGGSLGDNHRYGAATIYATSLASHGSSEGVSLQSDGLEAAVVCNILMRLKCSRCRNTGVAALVLQS